MANYYEGLLSPETDPVPAPPPVSIDARPVALTPC